ncbi:MAG: DUF3823 domain-containing protein [Alistipes sp.]
MKCIFRKCALIAATLPLFLVSCELDNFDGPDAKIYGSVFDIETGVLIEQDITSGTRICYVELGFDNPEQQYMSFMTNGQYRNNMVFSGKYDIYFAERNFVAPTKLEGYNIRSGENCLDFKVQPFVRISKVKIAHNSNEIVATFTVTPTVKAQVSKVALFGHIDRVVGQPYALDSKLQDVNEAFQGESRNFTLRLDTKKFKKGEAYYFRVGAIVNEVNAKYNYAPSVRLTM